MQFAKINYWILSIFRKITLYGKHGMLGLNIRINIESIFLSKVLLYGYDRLSIKKKTKKTCYI